MLEKQLVFFFSVSISVCVFGRLVHVGLAWAHTQLYPLPLLFFFLICVTMSRGYQTRLVLFITPNLILEIPPGEPAHF